MEDESRDPALERLVQEIRALGPAKRLAEAREAERGGGAGEASEGEAGASPDPAGAGAEEPEAGEAPVPGEPAAGDRPDASRRRNPAILGALLGWVAGMAWWVALVILRYPFTLGMPLFSFPMAQSPEPTILPVSELVMLAPFVAIPWVVLGFLVGAVSYPFRGHWVPAGAVFGAVLASAYALSEPIEHPPADGWMILGATILVYICTLAGLILGVVTRLVWLLVMARAARGAGAGEASEGEAGASPGPAGAGGGEPEAGSAGEAAVPEESAGRRRGGRRRRPNLITLGAVVGWFEGMVWWVAFVIAFYPVTFEIRFFFLHQPEIRPFSDLLAQAPFIALPWAALGLVVGAVSCLFRGNWVPTGALIGAALASAFTISEPIKSPPADLSRISVSIGLIFICTLAGLVLGVVTRVLWVIVVALARRAGRRRPAPERAGA